MNNNKNDNNYKIIIIIAMIMKVIFSCTGETNNAHTAFKTSVFT